jgi:hypothetical protein
MFFLSTLSHSHITFREAKLKAFTFDCVFLLVEASQSVSVGIFLVFSPFLTMLTALIPVSDIPLFLSQHGRSVLEPFGTLKRN